MRTTFGFGLWVCVGETAPVLVLCVLVDSVSGVVLGVDTFTMAWVTVSVLFDLLFTFSTAFKLERDDLCSVGNLIWMSFNSSCPLVWRFLDLWNKSKHRFVMVWPINFGQISLFNPFPKDKIRTLPNWKSLQTTISNLIEMAESSPKG